MINFEKYLRLSGILTIVCLNLLCCNVSNAKKIYSALYGRVYLQNGDSIIADGNLRVAVPVKKKPLNIIENPYSRNNIIQSRIDAEAIDSVVIWTSSAPEWPHTFRFIREYGWCFEAEHTPYV